MKHAHSNTHCVIHVAQKHTLYIPRPRAPSCASENTHYAFRSQNSQGAAAALDSSEKQFFKDCHQTTRIAVHLLHAARSIHYYNTEMRSRRITHTADHGHERGITRFMAKGGKTKNKCPASIYMNLF